MALMEREPALAWRRPALVWALVALLLSLGLPALILSGEGGAGQLVMIAATLGVLAALASLMLAAAFGRVPRARLEVVTHTLRIVLLAALAAPIAFQMLLHAMEGVDAPNGPIGLPFLLPVGLWPLALFAGLPIGLLAGLLFAFLAFRYEPRDDAVVTLTQATDPALAPRAAESDPNVF